MRVSPVEAENDKQLQTVYKSLEKQYGTALNPLKVMAHQPQIMQGVMRLYGAVHQHNPNLPEDLKELLSLRIAQINGCRGYCVPMHTYMLRKLNTPEEKIQQVARFAGSDLYSPTEKLALEYAERITVPSTSVSESFFHQLKDHFSEPDLVELTALIGVLNFWTKVIDALEVPLDAVFQENPRP
ncbi:carboxymuconolactone decarboxylase family protein [Candidatus Cyanaurora vandensis]|uniref:carboxymuconolactone decarboxylase family protein n=1 Tax=Candidatus Cyanaurora vandensis TaxID=2714958 RepID=UPI0025808F43|nr:carboxymuconolactone decarboxylase family protein [Candidatus Cyanaurora vandensis]